MSFATPITSEELIAGSRHVKETIEDSSIDKCWNLLLYAGRKRTAKFIAQRSLSRAMFNEANPLEYAKGAFSIIKAIDGQLRDGVDLSDFEEQFTSDLLIQLTSHDPINEGNAELRDRAEIVLQGFGESIGATVAEQFDEPEGTDAASFAVGACEAVLILENLIRV